MPARLRYKVEKKVRDHHRKMKKEGKKNGLMKRKNKPVTIPNNVPFREQIVREANALKEREKERKKLLKSLLKGDISIEKIVKQPTSTAELIKSDGQTRQTRKELRNKKKGRKPKSAPATPSAAALAGEKMQID